MNFKPGDKGNLMNSKPRKKGFLHSRTKSTSNINGSLVVRAKNSLGDFEEEGE